MKGYVLKTGIQDEWDDSAVAWADFVRKGKDYYRDELNNPATFKLVGNVRGQFVLDLACGEGYNTRILARKGAKVTGVDFSAKLIELARREEAREKLGIDYEVMNSSNLDRFVDNHFDMVTCFMALQDIEDYEGAVAEVARVLKEQGRFVFSIPHHCFEKITLKEKRICASEKYFGAVKYPIQWDMPRLEKHFKTTSFHRPLTDYSNVLFRNKLCMRRLVEPQPTQKGLKTHPPLREVLVRPQSLVIEAVKLSTI